MRRLALLVITIMTILLKSILAVLRAIVSFLAKVASYFEILK